MKFPSCLVAVVAQLGVLCCWAHREHKVHNIVLYPDKESWCKTTPIKQVVTWPQCSSQELDNNVCVGACFSYMVPHSEPSAPGDQIRPYCDSCQPLDSTWHTVTLDCKDKEGNLSTMQKKVQIITNCSCTSCTEQSRLKPEPSHLNDHNLDRQELAAKIHEHQHAGQFFPLPPQLPASLGTLGADSSDSEDEDRNIPETPDLLLDPNLNATSKVSGLPPGKAAERLQRLVEQLSKDPKMSSDELASALLKFNEYTGLNHPTHEHPGAEALLDKLSQLLKKYGPTEEESGHPVESESEEPSIRTEEPTMSTSSEGSILLVSEESPSEQPPVGSPPPTVEQEEPQVPSLQEDQHRVAAELLQRQHNQHHQHHHNHGQQLHHNGPHHSVVLEAPEGVKEKIDVESKYLQPAVPGQEISYHDSVHLDKPKEKDF